MDWTKLTPAPWHIDNSHPTTVRRADGVPVLELWSGGSVADLELAALARNFADVCERRGWGVKQDSRRRNGRRWIVMSNLDNTLAGPFDNLLDAWQAAVDYDRKLKETHDA